MAATQAFIAGEIITADDCVYINLNNGKAYQSDKDTQNDYRCQGIAKSGGAADASINVQMQGVVNELSGLTANTVYYVGTTGALTSTANAIKVGIAKSTTSLLLMIVEDNNVPIKTIVQRAQDLTGPGLTAYWHLMDGITLSDTESPMNGAVLRDINANNEFLRSADIGGGTGGSSTHTLSTAEMPAHIHSYVRDGQGSGANTCATEDTTCGSYNTNSTGGGGAHENKPPYLDTVAAIRIK